MKIIFSEIDQEDKGYIKSKLKNHKLVFIDEPLTKKNLSKYRGAEIIASFVNSELNEDILNQLTNLKYITTMSTGYDYIDLDACKKRKIKVSNVPTYGMNTVAEYTIGLILGLLRNIHRGINKTRKNKFDLEGLEGLDLEGKTIGIIGPGNIGQHVMRYAKAFGMNIITCGRHKNEKIEKEFSCKYNSLDSLLKKSDIISIHVPLTEATKHMINMKNIRRIKKGAYLINTSRGGVLDTTAILYALDKKILAGAALDVLEGEDDLKEGKQLIKKSLTKEEKTVLKENIKLLKKRNVIITPHIAFYTKEALLRIIDTTLDNIKDFSRGKISNKV